MTTASVSIDLLAKDKASGAIRAVGDSVGHLHAKSVAVGAAMGAALGLGIGKLVEFGKSSVAAFVEAQQSQVRLQDAFSRFPKLADTNVEALQRLNESLQAKTGADHNAIASGEAVLAQFNLTGQQLTGLTPLMVDFAEKTGRSLPDAATTLGKAFLGNTRALKELGISYKSTHDQARDTANITALLREKVGGFADKEGKTAAGQAKILSAEFRDLQEKVGQQLLPVLMKLGHFLISDVIPAMQQLGSFLSRNRDILIPLGAAIGTVVVAVKAWTVVQKILDAELFANPIGLVVIAIAGLVVGLVAAYEHSKTFRDIVKASFDGVKDAASALWDALKAAFDAIQGAMTAVFSWVESNWPYLAGMLLGPFGIAAAAIYKNWDAVKGFFAAIPQALGAALSTVSSAITGAFSAAFTWIGGKVSEVVGWYVDLGRSIDGALRDVASIIIGAFRGAFTWIAGAASGVAGWFAAMPREIGGVLGDVVAFVASPFKTAFGAVRDSAQAVVDFFTGPFLRGVGAMVSVFVTGAQYLFQVWSTVVGGIIDGAAKALGWVPGVGGKLKSAARAFDGFRNDVNTTMSSIAAEASGWGQSVGDAIGAGMVVGLQQHKGGLVTTMSNVVDASIRAGHAVARAQSPSKRTMELGKFLAEGLIVGFTGERDTLLSKLTSAVDDAIKALRDKIDTFQQAMAAKVKSARDAVTAAVGTRDQYASGLTSNLLRGDSITSVIDPTTGAVGNIGNFLANARDQMLAFGKALAGLRNAGLRSDLIQQVAEAGPQQGMSLAQEILNGDGGYRVADLNYLQGQLTNYATGVGTLTGNDLYGADIRLTQKTLADQLTEQRTMNQILSLIAQRVSGDKTAAQVLAELQGLKKSGVLLGLA